MMCHMTGNAPRAGSDPDDGPKIVVMGKIPEAGLDVLSAIEGARLWTWDSDTVVPRPERDRELADAVAAVTLLPDVVDAGFLDAAPLLRVVANVAVGYDNIDVAACTARSVTVTNTPGVLTDATADLAMALVLMTTRRLGEGERLIRTGGPWKWGMFMMLGSGLQGRTLGIVGMGGIGQALAARAKAFGMEVVYHNRHRVDTAIEAHLGARLVDIDELLATSDVVSLNCPHNESTHHLIDADALASMKSTAHLINTARGPIVDEAALVEALRRQRIAGAGLDVYEHEPTVHPGLVELENVVLVPHLGSATVETRAAMATTAAANVAAVLAGESPPNAVVADDDATRAAIGMIDR